MGSSPFTMFLGRWTTACMVEAQFGPERCERETPSFMIPPGSLVSRSSVRPRICSLSKTPATNVFWHAIALSTLPILFGHSQSSEASRDRYLTPDLNSRSCAEQTLVKFVWHENVVSGMIEGKRNF